MKQSRKQITIALAITFLGVAVAQTQKQPVEHWCEVVEASASVGKVDSASKAGVPPNCDGTCVVDVAFSYYPEALSITDPDGFVEHPRSAGAVAAALRQGLAVANGVFQASGVDLEFRFAGLGPMTGNRPRGDLWYVVDPANRLGDTTGSLGGWARLPARVDGSPRWTHTGPDGGIRVLPGDPTSPNVGESQHRFGILLAHEFGHSLGLRHGAAANPPGISDWSGGHGYIGGRFRDGDLWFCQATVMLGGFLRTEDHGCAGGYYRAPRFSSASDTYYGRAIGDAYADAVSVLRANGPHLAARSPSTARPSTCAPGSCIDAAGRFEVAVRYHDPNSGAWGQARMSTFRVSAHAGLFYFFEPENPELLLKVLNGCGVNGQWWVFGSAATDLRYEIRIVDLAVEQPDRGPGPQPDSEDPEFVRIYEHADGIVIANNGFSGLGVINDVQAFPCQ